MRTQEKTERREIVPRDDFVPDVEPVMIVEDKEDKVKPGERRERVKTLVEKIDKNSIELCRHLWAINKKRDYELWGYQSFKDYIAKEVSFKISKAFAYVRIWERLRQNEELATKVMSVGWAKARELIKVVTEENVDEWVDKAKHLNVEDLTKEVRIALNKLIPDNEREVLENVDKVEGTGAEDTVKTMNFRFEYQDLVTVSQALDKVKSQNPGLNNGKVLALICADFIATNNFDGRGKDFAIQFLKKYEPIFGLQITVS